jgi:hypothetical protein
MEQTVLGFQTHGHGPHQGAITVGSFNYKGLLTTELTMWIVVGARDWLLKAGLAVGIK